MHLGQVIDTLHRAFAHDPRNRDKAIRAVVEADLVNRVQTEICKTRRLLNNLGVDEVPDLARTLISSPNLYDPEPGQVIESNGITPVSR